MATITRNQCHTVVALNLYRRPAVALSTFTALRGDSPRASVSVDSGAVGVSLLVPRFHFGGAPTAQQVGPGRVSGKECGPDRHT
jgi:hypothetical protein